MKLSKYKLRVLACLLTLSLSATPVQAVEESYVRLEKEEFDLLKRQAFLSKTILQRIHDLETLYKQVEGIVDSIEFSINAVKKFLNIENSSIFDQTPTNGDFEHISGVQMSPGFVEFYAKTTDTKKNFSLLNLDELEMDIYFNKVLFSIDHIEGSKVFGNEFSRISLPQSTSAAKDRIKLPLSDVLSNEVKFKVFLAPNNPETIKVGDSTKLDIKYFKRVTKDDNGQAIAPLEYGFVKGSATEIKVVVK